MHNMHRTMKILTSLFDVVIDSGVESLKINKHIYCKYNDEVLGRRRRYLNNSVQNIRYQISWRWLLWWPRSDVYYY